MSSYLFSYGTLLPGLAPPEIAALVRQLHPMGTGSVKGVLYDFGRYPGAILSASGGGIFGQVWRLPEDPGVLHALDRYEEFDPANLKDSEFVRKETSVELDTGGSQTCWIYLYNRHPGGAPVIADGMFVKWKIREQK